MLLQCKHMKKMILHDGLAAFPAELETSSRLFCIKLQCQQLFFQGLQLFFNQLQLYEEQYYFCFFNV